MEAEINRFVTIRGPDGEPLNPRGPVRNTTDLAESMVAHGVLQPLLCVELDDGRLGVLSGHRRLIQARSLGMATLPYRVVSAGSWEEQLEMMMIAQQQKEHQLLVLDSRGDVIGGLAYGVYRYLSEYDDEVDCWVPLPDDERRKRTILLAGKLTSGDTNAVCALFDMVEAPVEIRQAIAQGRMSLTAFSRIRTQPDVQQAVVERAGDEGKITVAMARDVRRELDEQRAPEERDSLGLLREANALLQQVDPESLNEREKILVLTMLAPVAQRLIAWASATEE